MIRPLLSTIFFSISISFVRSTPTSSSSNSSPSPTPPPTSPSLSIQKRDNNGKVSWYNPSIIGTGACGVQNADTDLVVAVDGDLWNTYTNPANNQDQNQLCGATIFVSYQQVTKQATIVDYSPNLGGQYDLAVSTGLFSQLADQSLGTLQASWKFNNTPTPTTGSSTTSVYSGAACQQTGYNPSLLGPAPDDCDKLFAQLATNSGNFTVNPLTVYGFINGTCALQFCNYNSFAVSYDWGEFILYGTLIFSKFMNSTAKDSIAQCLFPNGPAAYVQVQAANDTLNNQGSYSLQGRQYC